MKTNVYAGLDVKANLWSPPITMDTVESLQQYLSVLVNTHGTGHYHLYPEDFVFYLIATYDDETGQFDVLPEREFAVNVAGLKKECKVCKTAEEFNNESE